MRSCPAGSSRRADVHSWQEQIEVLALHALDRLSGGRATPGSSAPPRRKDRRQSLIAEGQAPVNCLAPEYEWPPSAAGQAKSRDDIPSRQIRSHRPVETFLPRGNVPRQDLSVLLTPPLLPTAFGSADAAQLALSWVSLVPFRPEEEGKAGKLKPLRAWNGRRNVSRNPQANRLSRKAGLDCCQAPPNYFYNDNDRVVRR